MPRRGRGASAPALPAIWSEAGSPLGGAARQRERRPAERRERVGEADQRLAHVQVAGAGARSSGGGTSAASASARGRARRAPPRPARGTRGAAARHARLRDRATAKQLLELQPDVLAVEVGVLGEELAVDIGDLAHEDRVGLVSARAAARRHGGAGSRGRRLDPLADQRVGERRSRRRRPRAPRAIQLAGSKPGASAASIRSHALDVARDRPGGVEARRERPAAVERDEPVRRLVARRRRSRRPGSGSSRPSRCRAPRRRGPPRPRPPSRRSSRPRPGPGSAGSGRRRSAGSRRSSRTRTRAGSSCRRSRSPRPRAAAPPPRSRRHVAGEDRRAVGRLEPGGVEEILDGQPDPGRGRLRPGEEDRRPARVSRCAQASRTARCRSCPANVAQHEEPGEDATRRAGEEEHASRRALSRREFCARLRGSSFRSTGSSAAATKSSAR